MSDLGQREPQPAGLTHERQQPQHVRVVVSVAGRRAPWRLENPSCFVQPERLAAEAAARRDLPDEQSVARHGASIAIPPRGKVKGALPKPSDSCKSCSSLGSKPSLVVAAPSGSRRSAA